MPLKESKIFQRNCFKSVWKHQTSKPANHESLKSKDESKLRIFRIKICNRRYVIRKWQMSTLIYLSQKFFNLKQIKNSKSMIAWIYVRVAAYRNLMMALIVDDHWLKRGDLHRPNGRIVDDISGAIVQFCDRSSVCGERLSRSRP